MDEGSVKFFRYLSIIFKYKWLVLILFFILMISGVFVVMRQQELYVAQAKILVNYQMANVTEFSRIFLRGTIAYLVKTYSQTIVTNEVLEATRKSMTLPYPVSYLRSRISIRVEEGTNLMTISATLPDKEIVAQFVNTLIDKYVESHNDFLRQDLVNAKIYIQDQLRVIENELKEVQHKIRDFKLENNVIDVTTELQNLVSTYSTLKLDVVKLEMEKKSVQDSLRNINKELAAMKKGKSIIISDIENSPEYKALENLQREYEKASVYYNKDSRYITVLDERVTELQKKLFDRIAKEDAQGASIVSLYSQKSMLEKTIIELDLGIDKTNYILLTLDKQFETVPQQEMHYLDLQRKLMLAEKLYTILLEQEKNIELQNISQGSSIRIVDRALTPSRPITTSKTQYLIFILIISIIFSVSFAFLIEYLDTTVKPSDNIEKLFNVDLIGKIPEIYKTDEKLSKWAIITGQREKYISRTFKENLITNISAKSTVQESYKELRTLLTYSKNLRDKKGPKTFIITSSETKEGKSITAANLTIKLAANNKKTVIVDADMRKPAIHRIFELNNTIGLSDYFEGNVAKVEEIIQPGLNPYHYIITCGPHTHNSSEHLDSPKINTLIDELYKLGFEYIIFDTPPVNALTDAVVLSNKVDGVLFVIRANQIGKHRVQIALESLKKAGGEVIGVILNGIPLRGGYGYYYYYYGSTYYYSYDDVDKSTVEKAKK